MIKSTLASLLALACLSGDLGDPKEVDFAVLAGFDYKEGTALPDAVTKFDEKKVVVRGFMTTEDGDVEGQVACFVLINDACGCEGTPKLNEMVFCEMPEGETTAIKPGTAKVTGTLYVSEQKEDGVVVSLYTLAADSVE